MHCRPKVDFEDETRFFDTEMEGQDNSLLMIFLMGNSTGLRTDGTVTASSGGVGAALINQTASEVSACWLFSDHFAKISGISDKSCCSFKRVRSFQLFLELFLFIFGLSAVVGMYIYIYSL